MSPSLPQRLAVVKYLSELLSKLRGEELVPEAVAEWAPGARIPVKFGDDLAGWASVPKPSVRAKVTNDLAFTAWVATHYPHQIEVIERPYESFTKRVLEAAKKNGGFWVNADTGEKVLIPGVEVGTGDPYVKVDLADNAGEIIGRAVRDGDVSFIDLLAIEAPQDEPLQEPDIVTTPRQGLDPFRDEHGFLGPEAAAAHAYLVQGGFSTPPIEAYRMIRDGGVGRDRALAFLAEHGLDPDDPDEGRNTPWPLPEAGEAA